MNPTEIFPGHSHALIQTVITSYGEGHQDAPEGCALNVDTRPLRNPPDDPEVRDRMLHANGLDAQVRAYVLATPGALPLIYRSVRRVLALLEAAERGRRVDVHVRCGGGRHRSVVVAEEIGCLLRSLGRGVEVEHRHIDRALLS